MEPEQCDATAIESYDAAANALQQKEKPMIRPSRTVFLPLFALAVVVALTASTCSLDSSVGEGPMAEPGDEMATTPPMEATRGEALGATRWGDAVRSELTRDALRVRVHGQTGARVMNSTWLRAVVTDGSVAFVGPSVRVEGV